ncbi:hypothetical protein BCR42DRAFT_423680 [Absidia repens]|uniref:Uncharacterized protein n=1 Tax=Absidia repens TaxID=90262 RepID=A0A1X2I532_9FUNG|nr:hypothetical protein BCR42DRAFT_423680 [Absidia repens]
MVFVLVEWEVEKYLHIKLHVTVLFTNSFLLVLLLLLFYELQMLINRDNQQG